MNLQPAIKKKKKHSLTVFCDYCDLTLLNCVQSIDETSVSSEQVWRELLKCVYLFIYLCKIQKTLESQVAKSFKTNSLYDLYKSGHGSKFDVCIIYGETESANGVIFVHSSFFS